MSESAIRDGRPLPGVADVRERTGMPVVTEIVDARDVEVPLSRAAVAVGADGVGADGVGADRVIVDVHAASENALCDGPQAVLGNDLRALAQAMRQRPPALSRAQLARFSWASCRCSL